MKNTTIHTTRTIIRSFFTLLIIALLASTASRAAGLAKSDTEYLGTYEKVRAALADDNFDLAKTSAIALGDAGKALAASHTLAEARAAFVIVSKTAVGLAKGQPGYFILHCPMVNHDWVQPSETVSNPYGGKEMRSCGEVVK